MAGSLPDDCIETIARCMLRKRFHPACVIGIRQALSAFVGVETCDRALEQLCPNVRFRWMQSLKHRKRLAAAFHRCSFRPTSEYDIGYRVWWSDGTNSLHMFVDTTMQPFPQRVVQALYTLTKDAHPTPVKITAHRSVLVVRHRTSPFQNTDIYKIKLGANNIRPIRWMEQEWVEEVTLAASAG